MSEVVEGGLFTKEIGNDRHGLPETFWWLAVTGPMVAGSNEPSGPFRAITDPATGRKLADVRDSSDQVIEAAVRTADAAFPAWRWATSQQKFTVLSRWAAALRKHEMALAHVITLEQGKPIAESLVEVNYAATYLDWYAHEAMRPHGDTMPSHKSNSDLCVRGEPVGLVAAITPWNFPLAMPARKAAAALAAGCPVLLIPSVHTPLSALAFAMLGYRAGLDPSLLQILPGPGQYVVPRVLGYATVRAVSFTGSTRVGRMINTMAAQHTQRVSLELGGHAPFIVFPDYDVDEAVEACMTAKFTTGGQDCLAANRIFVHDDIATRFRDRLVERVGSLKVGHGLDPGVQIGPMTMRSGVDHCLAQVHDAVGKRARVLVGGTALENLGDNFMAPTILDGVGSHMIIDHEETFGPLAPLQTFNSPHDVLRRANRSEYGLAAYVFTNNAHSQALASSVLDYGMVAINTASFTGSPIPFGGFKASGLGKEGGVHGLNEFLRFKYTCRYHEGLDDQRVALGTM